MQPTPVFFPGESHGRGAWQATLHGIAELDTTEQYHHRTSWDSKHENEGKGNSTINESENISVFTSWKTQYY